MLILAIIKNLKKYLFDRESKAKPRYSFSFGQL